ncbi:MAG: APC family permease [Gammaproteobacteria bacterium]|nr:APC family permease [Gammaproteobacteria bacterium]
MPSYYVATGMHGGGAYAVWIVGALIILLLVLTLAEVITIHPKRGVFTRLLTLAYNHDVGYVTALANWFGMVVVIPTEAEATVQYLSTVKPLWQSHLFVNHQLTTLGLTAVIGLLIIYTLLNFWGVRLFAKSNNIISIFKIIIPVGVAIIILSTAFHRSNFTPAPHSTLLPFGLESTFTVVMSGGIVYAFNGFQCIASFAAEAKDPTRNIPLALVISVIAALIIYLILQTAFIGGIPTKMLQGGWGALNFSSPIAQLTTLLGLNLVSIVLYVDACISPSGTGIVYTGTTARMLTGMAQEYQAPSFFNVLHPKYHFSRRSLIFNILLAIVVMLLFRSWQSLMVVVSQFHVISYMACPLTLMRLRVIEPHRPRRYRLPLAQIISPILFIIFTLLYCSTTESHLILTSGVMVIFYLGYIIVHNRWQYDNIVFSLKRSYMFPTYFIWLTLLGLLNVSSKSEAVDITLHTLFYLLLLISSLYFYRLMVYRYRV